jgi:dihydrolipoamide dehydrogenase
MPDPQQFDLLILGGGMSYVGAIRAAQLGMKVGLIERDILGGTCLNRGCIPSKALLETADLLHRVQEQGGEFGLTGSEGIGLDYPALARRKDAVVDKHVRGVEFLMKKNDVAVLRGNGILTGPTSVSISGGESGEIDATAKDLILATGSAPRLLPGLEIDGERIITSDEALKRTSVPASVTIVGAGAVGVEWASLYRDIGAQVTLVEFLDRIVPLEDPDISKELTRTFRKRGIDMLTASTIVPESIERTDGGLRFVIAAREGDG